MIARKRPFSLSILAILAIVWTTSFAGAPQSAPAASGANQRFIVSAKSDADYDALRSDVIKFGGRVVRELRSIQALAVTAPASFKSQIASSVHLQAVGVDRVESLINPESSPFVTASQIASQGRKRSTANLPGASAPRTSRVTPDPAFSLPGLMWSIERIQGPKAWQRTLGDPAVLVGVADTGLDYTHAELASQVVSVVDFTAGEVPPLCSTFFGASDADWAALFGGPETTDWNGHGSWIGGNIAAALDGQGVNGIAPHVKLVALKISQWCGSAYDSTIIDAFLYAANHGIDVVSISFGGYLDRTDPLQDPIYTLYAQATEYAKTHGTVIVAAAGNEHMRIGQGGQVLSHGPLTAPGGVFTDLIGQWEVPGGLPGVVDVASTGNVINAASTSCDPGSTGDADGLAWCKPTSDAHQPNGVGRKNQLTYYSNYGPRIDVAGPGGARKFGLPVWDRGGTPGWPVTTADGFNAWEDFSTTSNWALEIPCYLITGPGFAPDQCYSTIQGTSMATPHASASLALVISRLPAASRHNAVLEVQMLKQGARHVTGNKTPPLSAVDLSAGDLSSLYPLACTGGYCHLGGATVSDAEAYGAGLVDASQP